MKKNKRFLSSLLIAASIFVAALPFSALAASETVILDYDEGSAIYSEYYQGTKILVEFDATYDWQPYAGDVEWQLLDDAYNIIDSGIIRNPYRDGPWKWDWDSAFYSQEYDLSGHYTDNFRIALFCIYNGSMPWCSATGTITVIE